MVAKVQYAALQPTLRAIADTQAAALELVVGDSKARSLTEVIGRKQLSPEEQLGGVFEADAAVRRGRHSAA